MVTKASQLSPSGLARMLNDKRIVTILHQKCEEEKIETIYDNFPRDVAISFCGYIRAFFPSVQSMSRSQFATYREPNRITIVGSNKSDMKKLFDEMLASCKGAGIAKYIEEKKAPFMAAHRERLAANLLQAPTLVTLASQYIESRLTNKKKSLSLEDIKAMYNADIYFQYRPTTDNIPASEVSALLDVMAEDDDTNYFILVQYVAYVTWAQMPRNSNSATTENQANGQVTIPSRQYLPVRRAHADFGADVDYYIESYKQEAREKKRNAFAAEREQVRATEATEQAAAAEAKKMALENDQKSGKQTYAKMLCKDSTSKN